MDKVTFIATGDAFMTRRLPEKHYDGFKELSELISSHDVKFTNLEITVHDREGYPSACSGGTWAMTSPAVMDDLKSYGFNIYNAANNHTLDYSHNGLEATMRHLYERGMNYVGIGKCLADACAPKYIECPRGRAAI
ncbi:MAG: CapA family protein, partial [Clostridiales bacterium]|nr:CapA family protein [Clostridiales bacterium]